MNTLNYDIEEYIIIKGDKNYIDSINMNIDQYIEKNINKIKKQVNIINCYELECFNSNILEILDYHDKVLNTSGEKEIYEVFEGYERKEETILKEAN